MIASHWSPRVRRPRRRSSRPASGRRGGRPGSRPARRDVGGLVGRRDRGRPPAIGRAAPAGVRRDAERRQRAVVAAQVLPAERAQGVLAVAGREVGERDAPAALLDQRAHRVRQRHPVRARVAGGGVASEQRQRLHVDAAHRRRVLEGVVQDRAEAVEVHAADDGRHQDDAEAGLRAAEDGALLDGGQRPPAERAVRLVVHAVELQEDGREARFGEPLGVARLRGEAQAVGVELEEAVAECAAQRDDLGQVVAHGGLASGELDVAAGGDVEQAPVPPLDRPDRGVLRRLSPTPPRSTPGTRGRSAASPRGARSRSAARARRTGRTPSGTPGSPPARSTTRRAPASRHAS